MKSKNATEPSFMKQLSLNGEQKQLAEYLLEKSGIDFRELDRGEFFGALSGLISPLDYALWAGAGFAAGAGFVWALWYFVAAVPDGSSLAVILAFAAFCLGVGFGLFIAACSVAVYVYRTVESLLAESFSSVSAVRREIQNVSPSALAKLSRSDVARGTVWIVVLPVVEVLLRRRLKLKVLAIPPAMVMKRAFRLLLPPVTPKSSGARDKEDALIAELEGQSDLAATVAEGASTNPETQSSLQRRLSGWLRRVRNFGALVFGGLAIIQGAAIATLAWLVRVLM